MSFKLFKKEKASFKILFIHFYDTIPNHSRIKLSDNLKKLLENTFFDMQVKSKEVVYIYPQLQSTDDHPGLM